MPATLRFHLGISGDVGRNRSVGRRADVFCPRKHDRPLSSGDRDLALQGEIMRGRRLATKVALLAGAALAASGLSGCGEAATGPVAPARPATGVCVGVQDCEVVASPDVDGDGVRDQVGFVVVHVKTATGERLRRGQDVLWFPRGEFYGAAPIDGRPGDELVVGTTMGAHTLFFTTLTVQNGRLERLAPPGGEREWMIDGAFSFHAGVTRQVQNGRAVVTLRDAGRQGVRPVFVGHDRTYVWRAGGWQPQSTTRERYRGEDAVAEVGGWHVRGLPRFPDF
jgi:hypothetical protein